MTHLFNKLNFVQAGQFTRKLVEHRSVSCMVRCIGKFRGSTLYSAKHNRVIVNTLLSLLSTIVGCKLNNSWACRDMYCSWVWSVFNLACMCIMFERGCVLPVLQLCSAGRGRRCWLYVRQPTSQPAASQPGSRVLLSDKECTVCTRSASRCIESNMHWL